METMTPLKEKLLERGYGAQSDLARELKMGEAQIHRYVSGKHTPSYRIKKRIAKALNVEVEELWPNRR